MGRSAERGFSLLIVMFVLIVMAVVGGIAVTVTTSDAGTAGARSQRAHALLAAETGLALVTASGDAATIEALLQSKDETVTYLPAIDTDGDGTTDHRPAYVVLLGDEGVFVVEGQLHDSSDRVISRARLSGRVTTMLGGDGYEGQIGLGSRSDGVSDERGAEADETQEPM